jgi:hypothetical protein
MTSVELLADAFDRIRGVVDRVVDGLSPEQLSTRLSDESNSIAWMVWHLTRIQDDHVAEVAGTEQIYTSGGWEDRFALPFDSSDTGYAHTADQVAAVHVRSPEIFTGYHHAVHDETIRYLKTLKDADVDRIVDEAYDPPVTLGVRLVSVISDGLQHGGQAAFVRGIIT